MYRDPGTLGNTNHRNMLQHADGRDREHVMEFAPLALGPSALDKIIGQSAPMLQLKRDIERAARCRCIVLIWGETGTGKMLVARALHELGSRSSKPFLTVNCGAIPENLIEAEFFGYVKGAFTGAQANKKGWFDAANGGMLFLDEIAEMPPAAQVKMLHVLQERRFLPVGATAERETDVRIIAATHRNLEADVAEGRLREDFYHRINGITLRVPPVRDRGADIQLLMQYFLSTVCEQLGLASPVPITHEAMDGLRRYAWPGNVRQIERMATLLSFRAEDGVITEALVNRELPHAGAPTILPPAALAVESLNDFIQSQERQKFAFIQHAIKMENGNVSAAAARLKTNRSTLHKLRGRLAGRLATG